MTNTENDKLWESYFYPETEILINNLNIKDQEKLKEAEATISFEKLLELNTNPLNLGLGKKHLKELHKFIFSDVYPFAGQYRKANMQKKIGSFLFIKDENTIDNYLDQIFDEVNEKLKRSFTKYDFSETLAYLYTKLIYVHPFREGNGRTIREFLREFSIAKSKEIGMEPVELDWRLINKEDLNKYLEVAHMFPGATALLFHDALVDIKTMNI